MKHSYVSSTVAFKSTSTATHVFFGVDDIRCILMTDLLLSRIVRLSLMPF